MDYITVTEFSKKVGVSDRYVRMIISSGKINGVTRKGNLYMIPADAELPPDMRRLRSKTVSPRFKSLFSTIQKKKAQLNRLRFFQSEKAERFREEFLVDYIYNSNAMEGNTLTLKETARVLEGITIGKKPLKDHLEVVGHRDALLYVEGIAKQRTKLKEIEIKKVNSLMMIGRAEDRGVFRCTPLETKGTYIYTVQPYMIEAKITELLTANEKRKRTMHPIERIARFYLEFEGIQPFVDGNGCTGRLIMNLDLIRNGYPAISVKFSERRRYYDALDAYYRNNSADAMISLVGEYVSEQIYRYLEILKTSN